MKINDRNGVQDPRLAGAGTVGGDGRTPSAAGRDEAGDQIQVSEVSRALARLFVGVSTVLPGEEEARAARVAALQQSVDGGTFRVDPEATARRFLAEEFGTLG